MKKTTFKAFIILIGLLLAGNLEAKASNNLVKEIADSKGLVISAAIIFGILLVYFVGKIFIKEEKEEPKYTRKVNSHRHHRHIVKKTA